MSKAISLLLIAAAAVILTVFFATIRPFDNERPARFLIKCGEVGFTKQQCKFFQQGAGEPTQTDINP